MGTSKIFSPAFFGFTPATKQCLPLAYSMHFYASVAVRHDGYMQAQLDTKKGRNLALLEEILAEMPDDPYMHFQLGKQYDIEQQYDKALSFYHRARELVRNRSPWYHDLVVRTIECLRHEGCLEEAMIFASDEMPYWDQSPDFYFVVGCLLLD